MSIVRTLTVFEEEEKLSEWNDRNRKSWQEAACAEPVITIIQTFPPLGKSLLNLPLIPSPRTLHVPTGSSLRLIAFTCRPHTLTHAHTPCNPRLEESKKYSGNNEQLVTE